MEEGKPAERIGDYEFLDRLAVGGMGQLWRVRHVKLDAIYVAKVLRPELREDAEFVKRFLNEARLVANLRHPNVVQVFDFDEEHMLYLMEYVEGMDLERLLRRRRNFELADKRTIVEVIADTIGFAHREHDLIHRDIKPSNVLIAVTDPDASIQASHVKLTDFGIARVLSIDQRVTMSSGVVMGTVHYMAPEQFEGHADKPSDVYAIGVLYYQLLTGKLPFEGPTAFVVRDKHISEIPPAPHELDPAVPLEDSLIVMKCLEKDPANRYQDGAELHEALASVSPTTRTMTIPHRRRRRPAGPAPPPRVAGARRRAKEKAAEARPGRRLRHLARAGIALAAVLVVLALLATVVLKPNYEIRWDTLRSEPQDTPRGVKVWVCPKIGFRLFWWPVGTIGEKAPPPWANWTTWFDTIDVKLSDGFYRQFVITCSPAEGSDRVDFRGATFEELARKHHAEVKEDPAGIPDYINAILVPSNVASAQSLPDVLAGLERVGRLLAKAHGAAPRKTTLDAYRGAASAAANAASALANGECAAAEKHLAEADTHVAAIAAAYKKELPDDFLFRATLRSALREVKSRAAKAQRMLEVLEPLADSPTSIAYTLKRYADAREAVADYLAFAPAPAAAASLPAEAPAKQQALEEALRGATDNPKPIRTALLYLAKLDAAIAYRPPAPQREAWYPRLLLATDEAASAARLEPAPWLARCLSRQELTFPPRLASFWADAHGRRVAAVARLCREFAAEAIESASASAQPDRAFKSAEAILEAIRTAKNLADEDKQQATTLLSTCCVRHALTLFTVSPTHSPEALAKILVLMDRGLTELPGCDPKVKEEALALRETLRALGPARQALDACIRENFSARDQHGGEPQTLFAALAAYERLAAQVASRGPYPSSRAALAPFEHLDAEACRRFSLPGAAAWWLLGKALEECQKGRYAAAAALLRGFMVAPGQEKPSPLKRLLPAELTAAAAELLKVAESFGETAMPAGGAPAERWRRLWERRLAACSTLPAHVPVPASPGRQEEMAAVAGLMGRLAGHFRQVAAAEEELRSVEAQVGELVVHEGGKVKPNPPSATPAAIARALGSVSRLAKDKRFAAADHPDRIAALQRDLNLIRAGAEGLSKQLDDLLAKPDPRAALDLLEAAGAALGPDTELALTRKALSLWVKSATAAADGADFEGAAAALKAIGENAQLKRHAQDPEIRKSLDRAASLASYCGGRKALAAGPRSFAEALANFKRAGECRDAPALVSQLEAFGEASALGQKAPLAALEKFAALLKTKNLNPQVARAAEAAAKAVRASFLVAASACVSAFNKRLTTGEWQRYLDRTSVSDEEVTRIKAFLESVENLQIEEPTVQPEGEFSPEGLRATLKRTRTLKFTLALPNARLPMTVVQTITWTLNYARPKGEKVGRWLITGWEEAN